LGLEAFEDFIYGTAGAERVASVGERGAEFFLGHGGFEQQQRAELGVAILFDDEAEFVLGEERFYFGAEGEASDAQVVGGDALVVQDFQSFADGGVAAA
jgi:hypothetical protein